MMKKASKKKHTHLLDNDDTHVVHDHIVNQQMENFHDDIYLIQPNMHHNSHVYRLVFLQVSFVLQLKAKLKIKQIKYSKFFKIPK